jgi:hypothetical protein
VSVNRRTDYEIESNGVKNYICFVFRLMAGN